MGKQHNIGIVGTGNAARLMAGAIELVPNVRLVAACDTVSDALRKFCDGHDCKGYPDVATMLQRCGDIDIVHIATPSGMHLEAAIKCAESGKDMLCEKPLEVNVKKMSGMVALSDKVRILGVLQNRCSEAAQLIADAADAGRFGKLQWIKGDFPWHRDADYYKAGSGWRGTWKIDGGGALMNQGLHGFDLMLWFARLILGLDQGQRPFKQLNGYIGRMAHDGEMMETEDLACVGVQFLGDATGLFTTQTAAPMPGPWTLEIEGASGSVALKEPGILTRWGFETIGPEDGEAEKMLAANKAGDGGGSDPMGVGSKLHAAFLTEALGAIETGEPSMFDAKFSVKTPTAIREFYLQAQDPQGIKPPDFRM